MRLGATLERLAQDLVTVGQGRRLGQVLLRHVQILKADQELQTGEREVAVLDRLGVLGLDLFGEVIELQ